MERSTRGRRLKAKGMAANNHLVMGPWCHSQVNGAAENLGPLKWKGDTAADFRRTVLIPFFDTYLKDRKPSEPTPQVLIYNPAENHWDKFSDWPGATEQHLTPLYLQAKTGLGFQAAPQARIATFLIQPNQCRLSRFPLRSTLHRGGVRGWSRISDLFPRVRMFSRTRLRC